MCRKFEVIYVPSKQSAIFRQQISDMMKSSFGSYLARIFSTSSLSPFTTALPNCSSGSSAIKYDSLSKSSGFVGIVPANHVIESHLREWIDKNIGVVEFVKDNKMSSQEADLFHISKEKLFCRFGLKCLQFHFFW